VPKKIDNMELTATLPIKSVQSNKLPFLRRLNTFLARLSPSSALRSKSSRFKLKNPRVNPENRAEKAIKIITIV